MLPEEWFEGGIRWHERSRRNNKLLKKQEMVTLEIITGPQVGDRCAHPDFQ